MYSHIQEQVVALSTNMNVEDIAKNEELERKGRLSFRIFVIIVLLNILFAGYLVYQILSIIFHW